jgi:PAS domain S-box-containing protein
VAEQTLIDAPQAPTRRLTVRRAILLSVLLGLLLPAGLVALIAAQRLEESTRERAEQALQQHGEILALGLQEPLWSYNPEAANKLIEAVMQSPDVYHIEVRDTTLGRFAEAERPERRLGRSHQLIRAIQREGQAIGTVRIEVSDTFVTDAVRSSLITLGVTLAIQVGIAFILITLVLEHRLVRPLLKLGKEADKLAGGVFDEPIVSDSEDEIGALSGRLESTRFAMQSLLATLEFKNRQLETDLVERERAEMAAQQSEAHLRSLVDQSPVAILEIGLDGHIEAWNPAAERIFEWRADEVLGRHIDFMIPHEDEQTLAEIFRDVGDARLGWTRVNDNLTKSGKIVTCLWYNNLLRDANGIPRRLVSIGEDITERRRVEEEMTMLARVVSRTTNIVLIADSASRITWVNESFTRQTGWTLEAVRGHPIATLLSAPETDPAVLARLQAARRAHKSIHEPEIVIRTRDDARRWVQIEIQPIQEPGRETRFIHILNDITARKHAEYAIAESAQQTQALIAHAPYGIFEFAPDGENGLVLLSSNEAAERTLGVAAGALNGLGLTKAFAGLQNTPLPAALAEVLRTGVPYSNPNFVYRGAEYEIVAFRTSPRRIATIFREVSDLRRAAVGLQELAQTEDSDTNPAFFSQLLSHFATAVDASHVLLVSVADRESDAHAELLAVFPEQATPREPGPALLAAACAAQGIVVARDATAAYPDDTFIQAFGPEGLLALPIDPMDGRRAALVALFGKEIRNPTLVQSLAEVFAQRARTEFVRQRTIAALRESESKFATAFHEAPIPMTLAAMDDGIFIDVNHAFCELFGIPYEEAVGRTAAALGLYASDEDRVAFLAELGARSELSNYGLTLITRQGSAVQTRLWGRTLASGGQRTILINILDLTAQLRIQDELEQLNRTLESRVMDRTQDLAMTLDDLRRAQDELVRAEKLAALGGLVAGVAHELNTPIGNGLMVATTLRDATRELLKLFNDGLRRSSLENYLNEADSASDILIRNLQRAGELITSFKQVAVDRTSEQRRTFELSEIVDEILLTLHPSLRKTRFRVHSEVASGLRLDSYPGPLGQVLTNLITNAVRHGLEGRESGEVLIEAETADRERIRLSVSDDGRGIQPENLKRVFDPFFTTRRGREGSGLGLHIVHNIVTGILGGQIQLESTPGKGARFILLLPRKAPQAVEAQN